MHISGEQFCNAFIYGQLNSYGQPLNFHVTEANELDPAIIQCSVDIIDSVPPDTLDNYNAALRIIPVKHKDYEDLRATDFHSEGLYNITYRKLDSANLNYDLNFEYNLRLYNESMDYTITMCGVRYTTSTGVVHCWSPTLTLIRYKPRGNAAMSSTSTPTTSTVIATTTTTIVSPTSTSPVITELPTMTRMSDNPSASTEKCPTITPPSQPSPLPPTTQPTSETDASTSLIAGASTTTVILIGIVALLVVIIGIMFIKLRSLKTENQPLQVNRDAQNQDLVHENKNIKYENKTDD